MISYSEIEAEGIRQGVSVSTIEKDYHLDWYLAALWTQRLFPHFMFYGGTAIKKLYVAHHRFSEDIDLISSQRLSPEAIGQALRQAHSFLEKEANLFYSFQTEEIIERGTQTRFVIDYRGFSQIGGLKRFLLDFAQGIEGLPDPVSKKLMSPYRDLKAKKIQIQALPLEVICADKLALVIDQKRKEPRDIYDLWSVFMQIKNFDHQLFLRRCQKELSYNPKFSIIRSRMRDVDFKNAWNLRLKHQVPHLPDFDVAVLELLGRLEKMRCF